MFFLFLLLVCEPTFADNLPNYAQDVTKGGGKTEFRSQNPEARMKRLKPLQQIFFFLSPEFCLSFHLLLFMIAELSGLS
jgi:hypothetical protein